MNLKNIRIYNIYNVLSLSAESRHSGVVACHRRELQVETGTIECMFVNDLQQQTTKSGSGNLPYLRLTESLVK